MDQLVPHAYFSCEVAGVAVVDPERLGEFSGDASLHPLSGEEALGAVEAEDYGDAYFLLLKWLEIRCSHLVANRFDFSEVGERWS